MHCPECNTNKKQREEMKNRNCGCCGNARNISFHRYVQYNLGWVTWLDGSGNDASVDEMNRRCLSIIERCYEKVNKPIKKHIERCEDDSLPPERVTEFYAMQFTGADCKTTMNF